MRKNFILLGILVSGIAFAQSGKVGINTDNPEATLDIRPNAANAATSATTNEGILIPRVTKARLNSIAPADLRESTLVYVSNVTGFNTPATVDVTSKGFYYYDASVAKWVKIAEGTAQEQDLRLVGTNNHITQDAGVGGNGTGVGSGADNIAIGKNTLNANTSGVQNIAVGTMSLYSNTNGKHNVSLGQESLYSNTSGSDNIAISPGALRQNTSGSNNIGIGSNALRSNTTGGSNIAMGPSALFGNTDGENNVALGSSALTNNTIGVNNIGIGTNGLRMNTIGNNNVALGSYTLYSNVSGDNNLAMGPNALRQNSTGNNNLAMGSSALYANTTGQRNVALGESNLSSNTTGSYNIGLGISNLTNNTTGEANIGVGVNTLSKNNGDSNIGLGNTALYENTTGNYNIALGYYALNKNTTASHNIGLGYQALMANTTGRQNIAMGPFALGSNITGGNNIALGMNAIQNNVTGGNNIALGYNSGDWIKGGFNTHLGSNTFPSVNNVSELDNVIVIGNGINSTELTNATGQDNSIILGYKNGHNRSPNVGLGTYKPDSKLHIVTNGPNAIKIQDTTQGSGKILTSDANGVGSWQTPAPPIADFTRQYARTTTNYDLPAATTVSIPGIQDFTAPKTGKYLVLFHSFLENAWETGTRNLYFIMLRNGATTIDADETYSYVETRAWFNQHYSNIIGLNAGDVVSFRLNAHRGKLRMNPTYATRNRIEIVYLGQ